MNIPVRFDTHSGDAVIDSLINASMGQIPGASTVYIFGHNPSIPSGQTGFLWPLDNVFANCGYYQANAVTCYVSSTNVADVGMILKINALDSNWDVVQFGVTLNGQTPVALPQQVRRVLSIENAGSTRFAGDIYAGSSATPTLGVQPLANTMNYADSEDQVSHTAAYTVPANHTLFVYKFSGGTPTNDSMTLSGFYSNPTTNVFKNGSHMPVYRGHSTQDVNFFPLREKTDIYLAARAYSNNTEAIGALLGVLVKNDYVGV